MCSVFCKTIFHVLLNWALAVKVMEYGFLTGLSLNPPENVSKTLLHIKLSDLLGARKQQKRSVVCLSTDIHHLRAGHVSLKEHCSCLTCHVSFIWRANVYIITSYFLPHLPLHQLNHCRKVPNYNKMGWIKHLIILFNSLSSCFLKVRIERRFACHHF